MPVQAIDLSRKGKQVHASAGPPLGSMGNHNNAGPPVATFGGGNLTDASGNASGHLQMQIKHGFEELKAEVKNELIGNPTLMTTIQSN